MSSTWCCAGRSLWFEYCAVALRLWNEEQGILIFWTAQVYFHSRDPRMPMVGSMFPLFLGGGTGNMSSGVEQPHHWAANLFICAILRRTTPTAPCTKLVYERHPVAQSPNWATTCDRPDAPCPSICHCALVKIRLCFGFIKAISSYESCLLLSCKATGASRLLRRHCHLGRICIASAQFCLLLLAAAPQSTENNENWVKCFVSHPSR